ncbi:uncharacterized protein LOC111374257 [Olea europaea var. sylvestris]|uniref:uncharacterized protein LOC111374257 n=1 Tax=Olea europaea var. sylvestris TaxID=158386 RepID=UPI000C1D43E6|nr:uncharacterized protein LOC111374257 [Olea europaea var. sylvestris]
MLIKPRGLLPSRSISSCMMQYQLEHLPCEHAVAATKKSGYSIYSFCSLYYTVEYWRVAYSDTIFPVPNDWEISENLGYLNVLPPFVRRRGRHPKTTKIASIEEFSKRHKCSRCTAIGHNRLTYTSQIPLADRRLED